MIDGLSDDGFLGDGLHGDGLSDDDIRRILETAATFAVVGASPKSDRPSFGVMRSLLEHGYSIQPVNPGIAGQIVLGEVVVADLESCTAPIDVVDIFRNSDAAGAVVDDAIRLKDALTIRCVWMQLGVINGAAARRAQAAGIMVVMNRCPKIEIARLGLAPQTTP